MIDFGESSLRAPRRGEVAFALEALDRLLKRGGCLAGLPGEHEHFGEVAYTAPCASSMSVSSQIATEPRLSPRSRTLLATNPPARELRTCLRGHAKVTVGLDPIDERAKLCALVWEPSSQHS